MYAFLPSIRSVCVFVVTLLVAQAAGAETVRIVIARGASLQITGAELEVSAGAGDWVALGASAKVTLDAGKVHVGSLRSERIQVRDAEGAVVRAGGRAVLGHVELMVAKGALAAVDEVDLETYVASVLGAEMPSSWPAAALEAQAVAARTFALSRKMQSANAPWHMEATVTDQVYGGTSSLAMSTVLAAQATAGLVLSHRGKLAKAFFFSSCVGKTESSKAAFGETESYLVPVKCEGGEAATNATWVRRIRVDALSKKLQASGALGDALKEISVVSRTTSGRIEKVALKTKHGGQRIVTGPQLRQLIGWSELPSLDVDVKTTGGELVFTGRGSGHGVGLCQWCARGQAENGQEAGEILAHFYPSTELVDLEALRTERMLAVTP